MNLFLIKLLPELYINKIPIIVSLSYIVFALFVLKLYGKKEPFLRYKFKYSKTLFVLLPPLFIILFFVFPKIPNRTEYIHKAKDGKYTTMVVYRLWKQKYVEVDGNSDGKVDYRQYRDNLGNVDREELDNNFDGKVDFWAYYNKNFQPIKIERDDDFNGVKDAPKDNEILNDAPFSPYSERAESYLRDVNYSYTKGKLTKVENKIDGRIYTIDYYNYNGKIIRSEGFNNDGKLDSVIHYDSQERETKFESYIDGKWESSLPEN